MKSSRSLHLFALAMLISGSIDSIRNLPTTALFGTTLIFFFIFSAAVFLIPAGLVSAELAATWTEKGGVYQWIKMAFGEKTGFFAVWLQWINTLVWYPTILSFIAGTAVYYLNPALATNKYYLISVILITFWCLTFLNLRGLQTSARFASVCTVVGMVIPMLLIIALFILWLIKGYPLQIHFTAHNMIPSMHNSQGWISLTAIMTAFLGMELSSVHVNQVDKPQKTFPRALGVSVGLILTTMILGSLAIAFVLPKSKINLVDGIMQAFHSYFAVFHLAWFTPVITLMLLLGSLGGMINWMISPAKGLLHAAQDGFLPRFLQKQNKNAVPQNLLILQAVLVSVACSAFVLMPSVNGSYWLLTDLSTQLYMLMYVFMFAAAIFLRFKYRDVKRHFQIPGGKWGTTTVGAMGVVGSLITLVVGFFPPGSINVGGFWHYEISFATGIGLMIAPVIIFFLYRLFQLKKLIPTGLGSETYR